MSSRRNELMQAFSISIETFSYLTMIAATILISSHQVCAIDSVTVLSRFTKDVVPALESGDTSGFNDFHYFLDSLSAQEKYDAYTYVNHFCFYPLLGSKDAPSFEGMGDHYFGPAFYKFWYPYLCQDSAFFKLDMNNLVSVGEIVDSFYTCYFSEKIFSVYGLEKQLQDFYQFGSRQSCLIRYAGFADSVTSLICRSLDFPEMYRSNIYHIADIADHTAGIEMKQSVNTNIVVENSFQPVPVRDLYVIDSSHVFLCGDSGLMGFSRNAGAQWQKWHVLGGMNFKRLAFPDTLHGFAIAANVPDAMDSSRIASDVFMRTIDGGKTWEPHPQFVQSTTQGNRYTLVSEIEFGSGIGLISTINGPFYSWDSGKTWSHSIPVTPWFSASIVDKRNMYCCNISNDLYKSADSGRTWSLVSRTDSLSINELHFKDSSNGWTFSKAGRFFCTNNGGSFWQRIWVEYSGGFRSMDFGDENHGMLVGNGVIVRTDDGGKTWYNDKEAYVYNAETVRFLTPRKGMVLTSNGGIYRVTLAHDRLSSTTPVSSPKNKLFSVVPQGRNGYSLRLPDRLGGPISIRIFALNGKCFHTSLHAVERQTDESSIVALSGVSIPRGVYILKVSSKSDVICQKILRP
jgi:photosystem II stability/assembly factor-like uncharacterized protein